MTKKERKRKKKLQTYNRKLIDQYPWLMPRSVWTGKPLKDYDYTWIEWGWTKGWDKAFGKMFMEELGAAIKEAGLEKRFLIYQIKEKFGSARLYSNGITEKINRIIHNYEQVSEGICIRCGKPDVPMINDGWYSPWCYECFRRNYKRREAWFLENHPEETPSTEEVIREKYEKFIVQEPDEDGKYRIPDTYTVRCFSKEGNTEEVRDISYITDNIRRRYLEHKHKL